MSLYDYRRSLEISESFCSLIMAAMRDADDNNLMKLKSQWPEVWAELSERYNSSGGLTEEERVK